MGSFFTTGNHDKERPMKKYKMIPEGDMFRILALVDIPMYKLKKGDHGGLVQSENNLSQAGSAWVSGNAQVYGNAWVSDRTSTRLNSSHNANSYAAGCVKKPS